MPNANLKKVLFADFATVKFNQVIQALGNSEVVCETVTEVEPLLSKISSEDFDVCVVNLLLGGVGPFELISNLRKNTRNKELRILVVTRQVHKANIQNTIKAGADDFIAEPFEAINLVNRITYHFSNIRMVSSAGYESTALNADTLALITILIGAIEKLSHIERGSISEGFHLILKDVADYVGSNRTNLIIVDEKSNSGVVLATSDDPTFYNFPISLDAYPEVLHVVRTGNLIFIEDVSHHNLTEKLTQNVKSIHIGSLMVFPVRFHGEVVGVLNIRTSKVAKLPEPEVMRALQSVANIMAAHSNIANLIRKIYKDYPKKTA